jgi:hypothetical protein
MFVRLTTTAPGEKILFEGRNDGRMKERLFCINSTTLREELVNLTTNRKPNKDYFAGWINIVRLLNKQLDEFRSGDSATSSREVEAFNFGTCNVFAASANV